MKSGNDGEDESILTGGRVPTSLEGLPACALDRTRRAFAYLAKHWVWSLACVATFLALSFLANLNAAFFLTLALAMLLMGLDSRISIGLFIITLALCPILLAMDHDKQAGQVAIWAYYFLAIGVVVQMVAFWREKRAANRLAGGVDKSTLMSISEREQKNDETGVVSG